MAASRCAHLCVSRPQLIDNIQGARVTWMGDRDTIATTGFSRMSDRQIGIWETGTLKNIKMTTVDQSSGVLMPFWSDNSILFVGSSLLLLSTAGG